MSSPTLPKYIQRPPRYVLQTEEKTLVRFAGPQRDPWEEGTEIFDISLTGLAFLAPSELSPTLNEIIKVEFQEPGGKQLACLARVVRLEQRRDDVLVACEFDDRFTAQKFILSRSLKSKFVEQRKRERSLNFQLGLMLILKNKKRALWALLSLCLFSMCLYALFSF